VERAFWPAKSAFLPTFFVCLLATLKERRHQCTHGWLKAVFSLPPRDSSPRFCVKIRDRQAI
jgi:hypothetical protein